jgi:hypothetical protein
MQNGKLNLDNVVLPDKDIYIVVGSLEGGTGSGSMIIIAKYLRDVLGLNVRVYGFKGFEEDSRGIGNSVEFFKDLSEDFAIEIIENRKFLRTNRDTDFSRAEALANKELAIRIDILLGHCIIESEQNMDRTDLFKVATNCGYSDTNYRELDDKIRDRSQFDEIVKDMIANTKGMDINDPSQTLMGVIINIPKEQWNAIDYDFTEIMEHYGYPYEKYRHIEYAKEYSPFIAFICTGMKMPVKEIQSLHDKYKESMKRVNVQKDTFREDLSELEVDNGMFNLRNKQAKPTQEGKSDFFKQFNLAAPNVPKNNSSNKSVKSNDMKDY